MLKLYSTNWFVQVAVLLLVVHIAFLVAIKAFDKHMYDGVDIVKQDGSVLFVTLDDKLKTGTDSICLEATYILQQVAMKSGCYVQVVPHKDEWVPFSGRVVSYNDLTNIIESGHPY